MHHISSFVFARLAHAYNESSEPPIDCIANRLAASTTKKPADMAAARCIFFGLQSAHAKSIFEEDAFVSASKVNAPKRVLYTKHIYYLDTVANLVRLSISVQANLVEIVS